MIPPTIRKHASYIPPTATEPFPVIQQESPDKYSVLETVKTARGARNMALDLKTKKIFLPLSDRGPPSAPTAQTPNPRGNVHTRNLPGSCLWHVVTLCDQREPRLKQVR